MCFRLAEYSICMVRLYGYIAIVLKLKNIKCWSYFIVGHLESVTVEGGDEIGSTGGNYLGLVAGMTFIY